MNTCLILGNGESLTSHAFGGLWPTFGCNYIRLSGYQPMFYVCIDSTMLTEDPASVYPAAKGANIAFLNGRHRFDIIPQLEKVFKLPHVLHADRVLLPLSGEHFFSGNTAVYVALKAALHLGYRRALLWGVDHTAGLPHFHPEYPAALSPNMEGMRYHFGLANEAYRAIGGEVINLSPPSALDAIFPRGNPDEWLGG